VDLSELVPNYLVAIPTDPQGAIVAFLDKIITPAYAAVGTGAGYEVLKDTTGKLQTFAPNAELDAWIAIGSSTSAAAGDPCSESPDIGTVCDGGAKYSGIYNAARYMITPVDASVLNAVPAIAYCADLEFGNYSDWYLPSKLELGNVAYANRIALGGFRMDDSWSDGYYWSSTMYSGWEYWVEGFGAGGFGALTGNQGETLRVRCVRTY
jgi:hypothetical protein